ncbi:MAG: hypothetical protein IPP34_05715 [Bacteroidetes bacterium]|nr:hypothetical protein [Bacteroidota bacterium]
MNKRLQILKYVIGDFLAASGAWALFYIYRKLVIESANYAFKPELLDTKFISAFLLFQFSGFWHMLLQGPIPISSANRG